MEDDSDDQDYIEEISNEDDENKLRSSSNDRELDKKSDSKSWESYASYEDDEEEMEMENSQTKK